MSQSSVSSVSSETDKDEDVDIRFLVDGKNFKVVVGRQERSKIVFCEGFGYRKEGTYVKKQPKENNGMIYLRCARSKSKTMFLFIYIELYSNVDKSPGPVHVILVVCV